MKEEGEHPVASKWRWDDGQRQRKPHKEKAWKQSQGLEEQDKRKWFAAYEDAAFEKVSLRELKDLEKLDSQDSKVRELKNWNRRKKQVFL